MLKVFARKPCSLKFIYFLKNDSYVMYIIFFAEEQLSSTDRPHVLKRKTLFFEFS